MSALREAVLEVARLDDAEAVSLTDELNAEYVRRYGGPDATPMRPDDFAHPRGAFLLLRHRDALVGCGGVRLLDVGIEFGGDATGVPVPDAIVGAAEIKRFYVREQHRGLGFARLLLAALETTALSLGAKRMVLETGSKQPEAVALYTDSGYEPMASYGRYRCSPTSLAFGRTLGRQAQVTAVRPQ